jgi:hypothetical protein
LLVQVIQKTCWDEFPICVVRQLFSQIFLHLCEDQSHFDRNALFNLLNFLYQLGRNIISDNGVFLTLVANLLSKFIDGLILIFEFFLECFIELVVALLDATDLNSHDVQVVFVF